MYKPGVVTPGVIWKANQGTWCEFEVSRHSINKTASETEEILPSLR